MRRSAIAARHAFLIETVKSPVSRPATLSGEVGQRRKVSDADDDQEPCRLGAARLDRAGRRAARVAVSAARFHISAHLPAVSR